MSIYNCHKQQPQPWMSYIASNKPCYQGGCCPVLLTNNEDTVEVFTPTNGFLYNGLVALEDIAPAGWHVPTQTEWQTLETFLGGAAAAGGEMKEDGTTHWAVDVGATNSSGFTALGSGRRDEAGNYEALFTEAFYWSSTVTGVHSMAYMTVIASTIVSHITSAWDIYGFSLRYIKDDAVDPGTLTGNNGIIYDTVTIGTQVWTVQNSAETRYRDGSLIEEISNQTEWIGLFRPAMCKYNNNEDYSGTTEMGCATHLLPFQVISNGAFSQMEYTVYGEDTWTEIVIPYSEVYIEGFYFITYNGSLLSTCLPCGSYEFRLTAGEVWYFEAITIQEFENDEVAFTLHDPLMTPLKFSETLNECKTIVAPCDSFLPFMYSTENVTTAPTYWLVSSEGVETELTITVTVLTIAGRTYYIHAGECFYPFLECGNYYLKIVDGAFTYYSVWFTAVCSMNDIPDGYRAMLDFNRCVMRDENGEIMTEVCANIPIDVNYGILYNWYAATDAKNIAASGWHIPTKADFVTLMRFLDVTGVGNSNISGGKLKEIGFTYWNSPNTGATNEVGFNGRGAGIREETGIYNYNNNYCILWAFEDATAQGVPENGCTTTINYNNAIMYVSYLTITFHNNKKHGQSVRPIKDSTILIHGQTGIYIGNDGKIYRTICIGTQEWVADNLVETLYRDLTVIPEVTDNVAWAALTTGAMCFYNNDESNAL